MAGVWPGLHLPGVSFANKLVAHRHPGLGRLAFRKEAHFRFARIALEFDADHLDVEVRQSKISARFHMAQHGGPDGFVIVDAGLLASGQRPQQECGEQNGQEFFGVRHCYLKYIRLPCGLGAKASENASKSTQRGDGSGKGAVRGASYSILSCLKRLPCDNLGKG